MRPLAWLLTAGLLASCLFLPVSSDPEDKAKAGEPAADDAELATEAPESAAGSEPDNLNATKKQDNESDDTSEDTEQDNKTVVDKVDDALLTVHKSWEDIDAVKKNMSEASNEDDEDDGEEAGSKEAEEAEAEAAEQAQSEVVAAETDAAANESASESAESTTLVNARGQIHVSQRHLWGTSEWPEELKDPQLVKGKPTDHDEVTVEFYSEVPVEEVVLRLPERQECDKYGKVCTGYSFKSSFRKGRGCVLERHSENLLPSDKKTKAIDISNGHVQNCTFDNTRGDKIGGAKRDRGSLPKRSVAVMYLKPGIPRGWSFFTIHVHNPAKTPTGRDLRNNLANEFQVLLKSGGQNVSSAAILAGQIKTAWVCYYTPWVRTRKCTADCGGGVYYSVRRLLHHPPEDYDSRLLVNCSEPLNKTESDKPCNVRPCALDCVLGDWTRWADGNCSKSCGGGVEVQRRRIIRGPLGGGKECPKWHEEERVRYQPCNEQPCEQRCEVPDVNAAAQQIIATTCSERCGGGTLKTSQVATRKDPLDLGALHIKEQGFEHVKKCPAIMEEECNAQPCKELSFIPAIPGTVPRTGQWFEIIALFKNKELTSVLELVAPPDYLIGKNEKDACLLKDHSFPRLRNCTVVTIDEGEKSLGEKPQQKAVFSFLNPLEPTSMDATIPNAPRQYEVRFWVKHAPGCSRIDKRGVCQGPPEETEWKLRLYSRYPEPIWETVTATYELHAMQGYGEELKSVSRTSDKQLASGKVSLDVNSHGHAMRSKAAKGDRRKSRSLVMDQEIIDRMEEEVRDARSEVVRAEQALVAHEGAASR
eukprot:gnl/TRDRNA2_/TRDRNA2_179188_c0_seq1.p1 gnl/TRDRNA2_/TRDRNA2_179188_c0~~gnl/TRDRNA2_/TRDRNA2_179188_c0_seq1.p1  ORF type:complete len:816 (+),score=177.64 gnl/TRDRNA2_/TRDRNA2_179188_c0_seq1:56-2503(+)